MSGITGALAELRREIDEIDQSLHDLLMRRAAIVGEVAATKAQNAEAGKSAPQIIYPAREAEVIRRLSARHDGPLPKETLVQVWREIISASVRLQRPMHVGMIEPISLDLMGAARDYFGALISARTFASAVALFDAVAIDPDLVGVLPFPELDSSDAPWWLHLASGVDLEPRVVARLPLLKGHSTDALVIGPFDPGQSSADVSLFVIESAAALVETNDHGGRLVARYDVVGPHNPRRAALMEFDGDAESSNVAASTFVQMLDDETVAVRYVGGYAVQILG